MEPAIDPGLNTRGTEMCAHTHTQTFTHVLCMKLHTAVEFTKLIQWV